MLFQHPRSTVWVVLFQHPPSKSEGGGAILASPVLFNGEGVIFQHSQSNGRMAIPASQLQYGRGGYFSMLDSMDGGC